MLTADEVKAIAPVLLSTVTLCCGLVVVLAKLYHNRVIAIKDGALKQKDIELESRNAELARTQSALQKAEALVRSVDNDISRKDLTTVRTQLELLVEQVAGTLGVQAASLYIPVFSHLGRQAGAPRSFAFVAVFNEKPSAAEAIAKMKIVEIWTIVGECWEKDAPVVNNELQSDSRHLASYESQSGFVALNTLALPIRWQDKPIGVLQLFNKKVSRSSSDIDPKGFSTEDKKALHEVLKDDSAAGIASKTYYFQANPAAYDFLGLRGESTLENTVIMHVDLTNSTSLFAEAPLLDAARMLSTFSEYIHDEISPYTGVVERFNGDGALIRFHYVGFDSNQPATNPVVRAVHAAERLLERFHVFKSAFWRDLTDEAREVVKLRIAIGLGPVVSMNMGSPQSLIPTVIGPCVHRSSKMVDHAPRDRDVALIDENAAKALKQQKNPEYALALCEYEWGSGRAEATQAIADGKFFELVFENAHLPAIQFRPLSQFELT